MGDALILLKVLQGRARPLKRSSNRPSTKAYVSAYLPTDPRVMWMPPARWLQMTVRQALCCAWI
ncbi:hypothetical protein [Leisingera thetidis]|uniref:hypothetical protein n=1 Tax=Leisingera thetidis TaxID=2930199 RepID=UPI0021F70997|nr:hypothetical protein [Leisingera thetidis]